MKESPCPVCGSTNLFRSKEVSAGGGGVEEMGANLNQMAGRIWVRAVAMGVLLTIAPGLGFAQERIPAGARVRVALRPTPGLVSMDRIIGQLVNLDGNSVVVRKRADSPEVTLPMEAVTSFEVSRSRKSNAGKGALIGLVSGAAGGIAAGKIVCAGGDCDNSGADLGGIIPGALGIGGALFGAGVGALVGGRSHHDRWERVSLHDLRMGFDREGRPGIRVSMRW